jgi:hypothetical protein
MTDAAGSGRRDVDRLLRWYPVAWRERCGGELAALVEDELGGGRPGPGLRLSLARAGLAERARAGGVVGDSVPPAQRVRAGTLTVLAAWAGAVLAGGAFAKASEHFLTVGAPAKLVTARAAHVAVAVAGAVGAVLVVVGVLVALPATVRFLRAGGWPAVRGAFVRASAVTVIALAALVPLSAWAHRLGPAQRNGADPAYSGAFVAWALLATASLVLWTGAGVALARRIELGVRALRVEAVLAIGVAAATVVVALAVAVWWAALARVAPWYLGGTAPGSHPSPWTANLVVIEGVSVVAVGVALYGVLRIARSWRSLPAGRPVTG